MQILLLFAKLFQLFTIIGIEEILHFDLDAALRLFCGRFEFAGFVEPLTEYVFHVFFFLSGQEDLLSGIQTDLAAGIGAYYDYLGDRRYFVFFLQDLISLVVIWQKHPISNFYGVIRVLVGRQIARNIYHFHVFADARVTILHTSAKF